MNIQHAITVLPSGNVIKVDDGKSLLDGLKDELDIRSDCGGKGTCGKCQVIIKGEVQAAPTDVEQRMIPSNQLDAGYRMACQVKVNYPMQIRLPRTTLDAGSVETKSIPNGPYPIDYLMNQPNGLGLAVDIGTTTIAAYLCDLARGMIVSSASCVNPQRRHGEDIVSRVQAASAPGGLEMLRHQVVDAIGYLVDECMGRADKICDEIIDVVVAGNTAMQHIFSGIDPSLLITKPFEPLVYQALDLSADEIGLDFAKGTRVFVMPVLSGFAGGDIVACALADGMHEREETTLIVDAGTNGELILGNKTKLWSTSCATGPAFEGAQISCGMRASKGAVNAVRLNGGQNEFCIETIGNSDPMGICGSGVIDTVLALRNSGFVLPSGQLVNGNAENGLDRVSLITADENPSNVDVYLTQRDIRQIQLAKAALSTGIICLLEKAGMKRVDRTLLTGAFGNAFNWRNAVAIGMLPDASLLGKVKGRPNLAGEGAVTVLFDRSKRNTADEIGKKTTYLHLADEAVFLKRFVSQTLFP